MLHSDQFAKYLRYVRQLDFEEDPDYDWIKGLFFDVLKEQDQDTVMYDWMLLDDTQHWQLLTPEERKRWIRKKRHQALKRKRSAQIPENEAC